MLFFSFLFLPLFCFPIFPILFSLSFFLKIIFFNSPFSQLSRTIFSFACFVAPIPSRVVAYWATQDGGRTRHQHETNGGTKAKPTTMAHNSKAVKSAKEQLIEATGLLYNANMLNGDAFTSVLTAKRQHGRHQSAEVSEADSTSAYITNFPAVYLIITSMRAPRCFHLDIPSGPARATNAASRAQGKGVAKYPSASAMFQAGLLV